MPNLKATDLIKRLLKTDVLYTANGKPIPNGMLGIDEENQIISVGQELHEEGLKVEYYEGALCPGFVNTHCHLELSHLKEQVKPKTGITGFIKELQQIRNASESIKLDAIKEADEKMKSAGIVAVGDISNGDSTLSTKLNSSLFYHTFVELFGFRTELANSIFEQGKKLRETFLDNKLDASLIPHSPYSVSNELFELIKNEKNNSPLSIHNQESKGENELYETGDGLMMEMMRYFGNDMSNFKITSKSALQSYLKLLPTKDPLLLVHNTFTSVSDIQLAEKSHSNLYWCFCPKANLYIENQLPNIYEFVANDVKCTLGTDSLASNDTLSIWEEIKTIKQHFPKIELDTLIQWGTLNGAQFLGINEQYGSLDVGKKAFVNWIKEPESLTGNVEVICQ